MTISSILFFGSAYFNESPVIPAVFYKVPLCATYLTDNCHPMDLNSFLLRVRYILPPCILVQGWVHAD